MNELRAKDRVTKGFQREREIKEQEVFITFGKIVNIEERKSSML